MGPPRDNQLVCLRPVAQGLVRLPACRPGSISSREKWGEEQHMRRIAISLLCLLLSIAVDAQQRRADIGEFHYVAQHIGP